MKGFCNFLFSAFLICFVLISNATTINYRVSFAHDLAIDSVFAEDGITYAKISLENCVMSQDEGEPQLPVKLVKLIIPADEEADLVLVSKAGNVERKLNYLLFPAQKPIPTSDSFTGNRFVKPNKETYGLNAFYPREQATILRTNYIRGNKVVVVAVYPVSYNPVSNQVNYSESIDISLQLKASAKSPETSKVKNKAEFDGYLQAMVDNKADVDKYSVIEEKEVSPDAVNLKSGKVISGIPIYCEYVVITTSSLASYFNDFIQWKRQKGIDIELVTTEAISQNYTGDLISGINDEAGKIRQFLYEAYQNGLEYALLGGDCTTVPIRYGWGSDYSTDLVYQIPTDLYFSDFDGDWKIDADVRYGEPSQDFVDYGSEISVGRLLCYNSTQIELWKNMLLTYEKNPGNGSTSYLRRAFYSQADELQQNNQANDIISHFNGFFSTNTVYQEMYNGVADYNSAASPQFPTGNQVIAEMNNDYGFVSWFNHGSPNNVAVATKLKNECGTDDKKKVTNFNNVQGWCGYIENSNGLDNLSNSTKPFVLYTIACETTPFDTWISVAPTDNLGARATTQQGRGGPVYMGNTRYGWVGSSWYLQQDFTDRLIGGTYRLGVAEANSKGVNGDHYVWLSHNLIGCPELEIWSATPSLFSSAYSNRNGTTVSVNTGGITNCTISVISKNDYGASYQSVAKGVSQSSFYNVPANYIVTITKHNYIPWVYQY